MDYSRPDLADRLAADYVAGTLRGPARRRFEALLPAHATLRSAERAWRERLMPLAAAVAPVEPSAAVWARIETRIHGAASAAPASAARSAPESWWRQLAFWRGLSGLATAAAMAFAVLLATPGPSQPPLIVVLSAAVPPAASGSGADAGAVIPASFVASISADGRAMVTRPLNNVSVQADRALELWSLPASGAPRSLGVIAADKATVVKRSGVLDGTTALAVTLEPPGGSPTGAPTGPVLYVGKLSL